MGTKYPKTPKNKTVLAREREARLKEERCRGMFSMAVSVIATRGKNRTEKGEYKHD
jgi:hypothetical protein